MTELASIKNSQDRFAYVVRRGRDCPSLATEFKTDAYRLEGCLAKVWLVCDLVDGCCLYRVDSESAIVKGIAVTLCDIYSGLAPEEIVANDPSFLQTVGIDQHLTQNRRDSLGKIWSKMRSFAESSIKAA